MERCGERGPGRSRRLMMMERRWEEDVDGSVKGWSSRG